MEVEVDKEVELILKDVILWKKCKGVITCDDLPVAMFISSLSEYDQFEKNLTGPVSSLQLRVSPRCKTSSPPSSHFLEWGQDGSPPQAVQVTGPPWLQWGCFPWSRCRLPPLAPSCFPHWLPFPPHLSLMTWTTAAATGTQGLQVRCCFTLPNTWSKEAAQPC